MPLDPWYIRAKKRFLRAWRTENPRRAAVRDAAVAGLVVLVLLGSIWIYTGQPFPKQAPLVVVESGSMMHGACPGGQPGSCGSEGSFENPGFGRVSTIDPGDLVLVKDVDEFADVETAFGAGKRGGYGGHGDVIVFKRRDFPGGPTKPTPIIHRAMLLVQVHEEGCRPNDAMNPCVYRIPETCHPAMFERFVQGGNSTRWTEYCEGNTKPVTLRLLRDGLVLNLDDYPCPVADSNCRPMTSGFLTKGDNNAIMDQPGGGIGGGSTCCPVGLDTIIGKARGGLPWFGLIKLMLYGNKEYGCDSSLGQQCSDPTLGPQWRVLSAVAPRDLWLALFLVVGLLVAVPFVFDKAVRRIRKARGQSRKKSPSSSD